MVTIYHDTEILRGNNAVRRVDNAMLYVLPAVVYWYVCKDGTVTNRYLGDDVTANIYGQNRATCRQVTAEPGDTRKLSPFLYLTKSLTITLKIAVMF